MKDRDPLASGARAELLVELQILPVPNVYPDPAYADTMVPEDTAVEVVETGVALPPMSLTSLVSAANAVFPSIPAPNNMKNQIILICICL